MDARIVHIVETEVPDFHVEGSSGVDLDSSFRQVGEREYENNVACEQLPLPVKSFIEGVDQRLESEPVAECLLHRTPDNVCEVATNIEDIQVVQEQADETEVVNFPEQHEIDQELIRETMVAKAVSTVETELADGFIGGNPEGDLNSALSQVGNKKYSDSNAYEQISLPVYSCVHGPEHEADSSVVEHLEQETKVDLQKVDTEMELFEEVLEQAVATEAVQLSKDQEVNYELVSETVDAKVVPTVEIEVPEVSIGGSPSLDSGSSQVGVREYGDHAIYEPQSSPVKSLDKVVDHGPKYDPSLLVAEHLEHRTTADFHEVDSKVKEVKEQAADTEAVKLYKEQEVGQKLVSEKLDAKVVPIVEEVPNVSLQGSSDFDSGRGKAGDREYRAHPAYEQPPLPVNSFDKGVDHKLEYEPVLSVAEHLEHSTTSFFQGIDSEMEDFKEMEEQAADTELLNKPVDLELVSGKTDVKLVPIVEKEMPDVSISSNLDLDSDPRQGKDRNNGNHTAYEQPHIPNRLTDKAGHLEHRATGNIHEIGTGAEDDKRVQEQAVIMEVVESPNEQDVDQIREKVGEKVFIVETEVSYGGSSVADLDSGLRQVGDREYEDNAAQLQPSVQVNSYLKGVPCGLVYEPCPSVGEHLEHRAIGEIDKDLKNDKEIQAQAFDTEAVAFTEEQVDQELVCNKMDAKNSFMMETEASNASVGGSPAADLDSSPGQVRDGECGDHVGYEQPSLSVNSLVEGIDNAVKYEAGSAVDENPAQGALDEVHEFDTNMEDIQEEQEQAGNTEAIELPEEQVDQELVSGKIDAKVVLVEEVEVPDICTGGSPGLDMDSSSRQVGDKEYGERAAYEQTPLPVKSFVNGMYQGVEYESGSSVAEHLEYVASDDVYEVDTNSEHVQEVQEQTTSTEAVELLEEQDQEPVPPSVKRPFKEEKSAKRTSLKHGSLMKDHRVIYQLPPENEGEFAVFDLVWGKVKSHPWWPGQIFHPSDSSEKAMKYYRKDCYLVAYFGDRTFAWNEASVLKPFRNHFPQAERQNNSEAFQNAVSCALDEVTRRVELGLACSCISEEAYDKIKYQIVENAGIREESSRREGVDRSTGVDSFQPDKLAKYVRSLALFPTSGADRLELSIAKAQLLAFNRLNGCDMLPEFQYYEGLIDYDADTPFVDQRMSSENLHADSVGGVDAKKGLHKRKHNLKDIVYQRRKEKSMTELMGEYYLDAEFDSHEEDDINLTSPTAGTKRKASGFLADDSTPHQSIKSIALAKVSHTASPNPQKSFKVGECIRRVASQLTGSSMMIKGCSEGSNYKHSGDDADEVSEPPDDALTEGTPTPSKESSLDEILSQLHLSARDPMKGYSFLGDIISFFSEFRNLAVTTQRQKMRKASGRKRKPSVPAVGSPENFEFDDRNDSYWTDMVIQNSAEAKPARVARRVRNRKDEQIVSGDPEKPLRPNRRKYSRKQYHQDNHESAPETPTGNEKLLDLPTELMLSFGETSYVLSEVNLNKMFRRFGPLKESETEVDMQSSRARVVFKKRSDAEVAYSSAAMFNIFGTTQVNYELNYTPSTCFKNTPLALTDAVRDAT